MRWLWQRRMYPDLVAFLADLGAAKHWRDLRRGIIWVSWVMLKYQGPRPAMRVVRMAFRHLRQDIALDGVHRRYMKMRGEPS